MVAELNVLRDKIDEVDKALLDLLANADATGRLPLGRSVSVKNAPLQVMLAAHNGPVLGLHPMFGSDSGSLAKQVVVYCEERQPEAYQWFLEQIQVWGWGTRLHRSSAVERDQNMSFIYKRCVISRHFYLRHASGGRGRPGTIVGAVLADLPA